VQNCLICDDHAMLREALAGAVAVSWPDAAIVQCADFPSAWAAAEAQPDLILSDLIMPGAMPLEGVGRLRTIAPASPILVVTGNQDDSTLLALFNLGVSGFAPKTSNSGVIEAAIRLILAGGRYLPPSLLDIASQRGGESSGMPNRLTPRQIDVLKLISTGHSNKEIARDLDLSPATIKAHTSAAIAVLGAVNRAEAVFKARELGLI
jgi:two-component system nitrate/nitrite response regulator NarL